MVLYLILFDINVIFIDQGHSNNIQIFLFHANLSGFSRKSYFESCLSRH